MPFPHEPAVFRFGGGLNLVDAPDMLVERGQTRQAENWRLSGRGWVSTRKAALQVAAISSWRVIAVFPFNQQSGVGAVLLLWNGSSSVRLATVNGSGGSLTVVATLPGYESGVTTAPEFVGAVLGRMLFMCDTARQRGLVIYDPNHVLGGQERQSAFLSGSQEPVFGQVLVGATSGATGVYMGGQTDAGSWGGGNASGFIRIAVTGATGTFQSGEDINIQGGASNVLTLNGTFGSLSFSLFQPRFDFNNDSVFAVAKPSLIVEHANHLWMFGYGDEAAPDRGELARFSYLGLSNDFQGAGDAGDASPRPGSLNLFDTDDFAPVGRLGTRVISAGSAPGRLGIALENGFGVVYGTGRDNWQYDFPIDTERGSVAARSMIEGDGVLWWYSPLGIARYRGGGQVEDLSRPADPLTEDIDFNSLFAVHYPQENQVRWYYRRRGDTVAGADRWLGFNYLENGYEHDELGYRAFCAGWLLPSGAEAPAAAPSGLTHEAITRTSARAVWTAGDTAPGVLTRVYRAPNVGGSPGTFIQVAELGPGAREFPHVGLIQNTSYWTKVEHFRNNQVSSSVQAIFTTANAPTVPTPVNLQVTDSPVLWDQSWTNSILITFDIGGLYPRALRHRLERRISGGAWSEITDMPAGRNWWREYEVTVGVLYEYRVRAFDETEATFSSYSSIVGVTPAGNPYPGWPEGL